MDPFIAQIIMFGGNFAPRGWAFCNGQLMAISSNNALFSLIGTTYGGDGRSTFALPDLRGRAPIHAGTGPGLTTRPLGYRSGTETVTLTPNQMPQHTHLASATNQAVSQLKLSPETGTSQSPIANGSIGAVGAPPKSSNSALIFNDDDEPSVIQNGMSVQTNVNTQVTLFNSGGSQWHNNMQPYLAVNYIIALYGTYPSRS
ncbi:phage tail protein [Ferrimonas aestuarii]|uniref:Phage tail protein n=1 Tax=Ferrimonas aestuarii TaxID=2569539 RepID=A0A4U1BSM6_9GAMM|nr:tail fiber protein [Ferrimonas aestuarii]TKB56627.1 phage tail protein [Ferrimonas aestuarii]